MTDVELPVTIHSEHVLPMPLAIKLLHCSISDTIFSTNYIKVGIQPITEDKMVPFCCVFL